VEQQTIHLVLRNFNEHPGPVRPAPAQAAQAAALPADHPHHSFARLVPPGNVAEMNAVRRSGVHGQHPVAEAELNAMFPRAGRERWAAGAQPPQHQQGARFGLPPPHATVQMGYPGPTPQMPQMNLPRTFANQHAQQAAHVALGHAQAQAQAQAQQYLLQQQQMAMQLQLHQQQALFQQHMLNYNQLNPQDNSGRNSPAFGAPNNIHVTTEQFVIGPDGQYTRVIIGQPPFGQPPPMVPNGHFAQLGPRGPVPDVTVRGPLLPHEVEALQRGADQATRTMTGAMHRSASGASLANMNMPNPNAPVRPIPPGVTTPIMPGVSRQGSRTASPAPAPGVFAPAGTPASAQRPAQRGVFDEAPEVYLLSSPTGPQAVLLVDGAASYYSPAQAQQVALSHGYPQHTPLVVSAARQYARHNQERQNHNNARLLQEFNDLQQEYDRVRGLGLGANPAIANAPPPFAAVQAQARAANQRTLNELHGQAQAQPGQPRIPRLHQRMGMGNGGNGGNPAVDIHVQQPHPRPANAGAAAVLAAIWPHIWLIVRLVLFVWWFTSADNSWSRWITVTLIAIAVFVVNTGILNGPANQFWEPLRQHLEGLLPLAVHPHAAAQPPQQPAAGQAAVNNNNDNPPAAPAGQQPVQTQNHVPDPAQAAARLVAQRRENNANWLLDQVRRAERAMLLFLASLAPGVAERHIAHLEAQERAAQAERERIQRDADEARARAEAQETPADAAQGQITARPPNEDSATQTQNMQPRVEDAEEEPLIPV
jgi:hypothetical protein